MNSPWRRHLIELAIVASAAGGTAACVVIAATRRAAEWVSASAAIVQAVAAGAAIYFSIKLARESSEREIAAERAATRRAEAADEAAANRARQADEAAAARARGAAIDEFNEPIIALIAVGENAVLALDQKIEEFRRYDPGEMVWPEFPPELRQTPDTISAVRDRIRSPDALQAAADMVDATRPANFPIMQNAATVIDMMQRRAASLDRGLATLRRAIREQN